MIGPQAKDRGLTVDHQGCRVDAVVLADRARVGQIVLNLLSNAVKFTADGGTITVTCRTVGDRVELAVRDTGIGIAADKLEAIFEPFVQLGRSLSTGHEGAGLGLAIGRDLARALRGDLTVQSTLGAGSVFTLTLPRSG
jgi:signal transduction histidine kinase